MSVYLSPVGGAGSGAQFLDDNGVPLAGGKLYTYQAGTTTPQPTYTTSNGLTAHTNPIILNAAGRVPDSSEVWLDNVSYKFVLKKSTDVLVDTWDNISGIGAAAVLNFTGDGLTTAYGVNGSVQNVYINGVYQNQNTYSVVSTTLTFSEAPPYNSIIEILYN
jgi:hypothetical protein